MAPVYEGKGRRSADPSARPPGPRSFVLPAAPRRQPPARSPGAPPPGLAPAPAPKTTGIRNFTGSYFQGGERGVGGGGSGGGRLPEEKRWGGGAGKRQIRDRAFHLFVINKGNAVWLSSCTPPPRKITFRMICFASVLTAPLSVSLHSHPTLLSSWLASGFGGLSNRNVGARW